MNIILKELCGSNSNILQFFGENTHDECLQSINEKFGSFQHFVKVRSHSISYGCTCNYVHELLKFDCNPCYKYLVEQDVINLRNMRDFYPEDFTIEMRAEYDAIVKECNRREIDMNVFVIH